MSEFLLGIGFFILATVAVGLARILRGPADADRMIAAQLLGTGVVAALMLMGVVVGEDAILNVALTIALLAAFASVTFYKAAAGASSDEPDEQGRG
jgi:multicomponent Na+:H+ antiporter subunit F